ncbi:MAG: hypothetical protein RSD97_06440 [Lachnospiraceae bacterium]
MKMSIEIFVSIIIITLTSLLGTCYITASLNIQNAQNYHATVLTEIEASDFSESVICSCIENALDNGYKKGDGTSGLQVTKASVQENQPVAEVILTYDYSIPLLNMFLKHEIIGYAR